MKNNKYQVKRRWLTTCISLCIVIGIQANTAVKALLERIDKGASAKFVIEEKAAKTDYFELDQYKDKVVVRGNNAVSISMGIGWYLKHHAGIQICWNQMHPKLPNVLPAVKKPERHTTDLRQRYYLNYCTFSYSMAFWDWNRWQEEIDWMALHGINMPLAAVGMGSVWRNVLRQLGYSKEEVNSFVAGAGFQGWWLMNNLEGWGGPNPDEWYRDQEQLQKLILKRMRALDMKPVLPGYSGMLPSNAHKKLGLDVIDQGKWNNYNRPSFLLPTNQEFERIAKLYYNELTRLYGKAPYYSMDPFHEGGNTKGVNLAEAGKAICKAMKRANPKAVWVVQAWGGNPLEEMIAPLKAGDMMVLDLFSETRPQWDEAYQYARKNGYGQHNWIFCMLLNFGGNVGLHGKMQHIIDQYYKARKSRFGSTLQGVGLTMEGIENNPVMYELLTELPWYGEKIEKDKWLQQYITARYGKFHPKVWQAWQGLSNTIYACPPLSNQEGCHESIFCARPSLNAYQVSTWSNMTPYYQPNDIIRYAGMLLSAADTLKDNDNFCYDLIDITRQAVAEKGRLVYEVVKAAYKAEDKQLFNTASDRFLELIRLQDYLLGTRREFRLGTWMEKAQRMGHNKAQQDLYQWNARVQITTWGDRATANKGKLHDYAHKEWNGLLQDFYYMRWKTYFEELKARMNGKIPTKIDFYALEEAWVKGNNIYLSQPQGNAVEVAKEVYNNICR